MEQVKAAITSRLKDLILYSPYNILRDLPEEKQEAYLLRMVSPWASDKEGHFCFSTQAHGHTYHFLYQALNWDSNYFNHLTYKLFSIVYTDSSFESLFTAVANFKAHLSKAGQVYCFIEIPAEEIYLAQALTASMFRLTETRLTYFHDQVEAFDYGRYPVRAASTQDILSLRNVASTSRNHYDRYHADIFFTPAQADDYLATYAEACVNGLCDTVLVPAEDTLSPDAFLAISRLEEDSEFFGVSIARIVLTAVGPSRRGWHVKLVAETLQYAKERHCQFVLMTTQATNRAVFRTAEKLGFKLGGATHILAINL